jgi:hypothetical protein
MRSRKSAILGASAWCDDCKFEPFTRNAMGLAAIHADSHPGHTVHVEQTIGVTYNPKKRDDE